MKKVFRMFVALVMAGGMSFGLVASGDTAPEDHGSTETFKKKKISVCLF